MSKPQYKKLKNGEIYLDPPRAVLDARRQAATTTNDAASDVTPKAD